MFFLMLTFFFLFLSFFNSRMLFVIPVDDIVEYCCERSPYKVGNDEVAGDRIDIVEYDPK